MASEGDATWLGAAIGAAFSAFALGIWQFFLGRKDATAPSNSHVIVEAGELTDMQDVRRLAKEFAEALDKLGRIEALTGGTAAKVEALLKKIEAMERAEEVAKVVREEVASALAKQRRRVHDEE